MYKRQSGGKASCNRHALLFLFGKKLVLWLPLHLMNAEQLESIMRRFRNHGVEVRDIS